MTFQDILLQQIINGLSLGAMYSLLALGFTMVYGIIELINFAHFNVFMVGSFFALWVLEATGLIGQRDTLAGFSLAGVLLLAFAVTMLLSGMLGILIERLALRSVRQLRGTAPMILTIGISYILFNIILLTVGADTQNFPNPIPVVRWEIGGAVLQLREVLVWTVSSFWRFSSARLSPAPRGSFSASTTTSPVSSSATRPACAPSPRRCWAG